MFNYRFLEKKLDDLFMDPVLMEEVGLDTRGIQLKFSRDNNCFVAKETVRFHFDAYEELLTICILAYEEYGSIIFIIKPLYNDLDTGDILNEFNANHLGNYLSAFVKDNKLNIQAKGYFDNDRSFINFVKKSFLEFMSDDVQDEIPYLLDELLN